MARPTQSVSPRPGLPAPGSVVEETVLVPRRGPAGAPAAGISPTYRVIRTNEFDATDAVTVPEPLARPAPPVGDDFVGQARKAAKLSIGSGAVETVADIRDLLRALPSKNTMGRHKPPISTDASSERVQEEQRNIRMRVFLYASSREADNDFHLVIGSDPAAGAPKYMTAEVSGLPSSGSASFAQLNATRDAFKTFFGDKLPGPSYDFYDPPIPLDVEGSLFFDMSHIHGTPPGPPSLRGDMPTIWELHPLTKIVFEP